MSLERQVQPGAAEPAFAARELLGMTQEEFSAALKGSPMKRAKLRGLKRNAAVVLGNVGTSEDTDVLTRALDDTEPLVREHAAWALGRIGHAVQASSTLVRCDGNSLEMGEQP